MPLGIPVGDPLYRQRLNFGLEKIRSMKGRNVLGILLDRRPRRVDFDVIVSDVDLVIEHGPYHTGLNRSSA